MKTFNHYHYEGKLIENIKTKYYGIWIVREGDNHWLSSDNGDELCTKTMPTDNQIEIFRKKVTR